MRLALTASLLVASLSPSVFAVGQYLEKGQNGIGLAGSLDFSEEVSQFGAGLGYSIGGLFDVTAAYSRSSVETEGAPSIEFGGNNFMASLMGHPLKQNASLPVGLSLEAGYMHTSYGGGDLEDLDMEMSANGFALGGILHRTQALSQTFSVLLGAGYSWSTVTVETTSDFGDAETEDSGNAFPLVLEGIVNLTGGAKMVFGPSFTINEDVNVFGLGMSYIKAL